MLSVLFGQGSGASREQCLRICSSAKFSSKILLYVVKNTNFYTYSIMEDCGFEGWAMTVLLTSFSRALIRGKVLSLCNLNSEIFPLDSLEK